MSFAPRSSSGFLLPSATHLLLLRLLAVSLTGVIAWLTLTPWAGALPAVNFAYLDKLEHVGAFLGWVTLVTLAWPRATWEILILAAVFGGAIELIQPFVGRDAELADFWADMVGAGAGLGIGLQLRAWRGRKGRQNGEAG